MNKRITSLLLCFVMVFAMLATAVPALAAPITSTELKVIPDKTTASPGDIITYTIGHNKAETVKDRPGDDDALQPGTGFVHRPPRFGKIHHQQCDSGGHNGSNGRDREDLRIHILHDLVGLFPYRCRRKGGHRVCRQHRGAEKTGKKKTPPVDMAALLPVLRLCGFQLIFHCVPP